MMCGGIIGDPKNKKINISIIIILLIIFTLIGIILINLENDSGNYNTRNPHVCKFRVEINLTFPSSYKVTIPLAVNQNGTINEVMDDLKIISGTASIKRVIIDDDFALEIEGNTNLTIENIIYVNWHRDQYPILSLVNSTMLKDKYEYTIFLKNFTEKNILKIKVYLMTIFSYSKSQTEYQYIIEGTIKMPVGEKNIKGLYYKTIV